MPSVWCMHIKSGVRVLFQQFETPQEREKVSVFTAVYTKCNSISASRVLRATV